MIPPRKRRKHSPFQSHNIIVPQARAIKIGPHTLRVFLAPSSIQKAQVWTYGPDMLVKGLLLRQLMSEGVSRYGTKFEYRQKSSLAFCTNARHYTSAKNGGRGRPLPLRMLQWAHLLQEKKKKKKHCTPRE